MKQVTLKAIKREKTGKETAKKLRKQGFIPAILYGPGEEPIPVAVKFSDFEKIINKYKGETLLFNIQIENSENLTKQAVLKDYQTHPVTDKIIHLDFLIIREDETVTIDVPLEFVGKPIGIPKGGFLEIHMHEISIECLPKDIPDKIEVDISNLDIGDVLHVKDIKVPENIKIAEDPEETVVTIVAEAIEATGEEETSEE